MTTVFRVEIDWNHDGTWTDETPYTRHIWIRSGFERPGDLVAGVGRCRLTLDNTSRRFSPGAAGSPLYGRLLPRRAVRVRAFDGAESWTLFRGVIERITPQAGAWCGGEVTLEAVDGIALLARQSISLSYASSQPVDAVVAAVVSAAYTPPAADYHANGDTLAHVGRAWPPEQTSALDALRTICAAVHGRFFVARDGTAVFLTRTDLQCSQRSPVPVVGAGGLLTLSNAALDEMALSLDVTSVINRVQVTVYPAETVGAPQVMWQARTVLRLAPGETRVIYAPFRDDRGQRCGAVNVAAPQAGTDYLVNEKADGSGFNYTYSPSFSLSTQAEATRLRITLSSTALGTLYVTRLQVRGQPVVAYDPITLERDDPASQDAYELRAQSYDLPMQPDPVFGAALADYVLGRHRQPALAVERVTVRNRDRLPGTFNLFAVPLMGKAVIDDAQTGARGLGHWVRGVEYDLSGREFRVALDLERADDTLYWLLGESGYGEVGTVTRLGF